MTNLSPTTELNKKMPPKVQFWIEQGLLPYLLKDVPHTIVERSSKGLKIEIEANGFTILNLVFAAKAFGADSAFKGMKHEPKEFEASLFEQIADITASHAKLVYGIDVKGGAA